MPHPRMELETQILAAFRTAHKNAQWDAAEYLLCALEALQFDARSGPSLAHAYALIAPKTRRHGQDRGHGGRSRNAGKMCRRVDA